jgi:hypothetical protein
MKTFTRIGALLALCFSLSYSSLYSQTCLQLEMVDALGDGWNGGVFELYSFNGDVLQGSLTLDDGDQGTGEICVPDGCYYISMIPGTWPGEISWTLTGSDEGSIDGNANSNGVVVSVNSSCVVGCTDINATNFNPAATIDNGTCLYCSGGSQVLVINMFDSLGDGWNGASAFVTDDGGNVDLQGDLINGASGQVLACIDPGCYSITVTDGTWPEEVSWNVTDGSGNILFEGGAGETYGFSWAGQTGCIIPGCTDAGCNNYNPFATEDDGSCLCPPANDDCANAIAIGCGSIENGTTVNANMDGADDCNGIPVTSPGVWYTFIGTGEQVTISTCTSAAADTRIHVYAGSCNSPVCMGANDDGCGLLSSLTFTTLNGIVYNVLVSEFGAGNGVPFVLDMTCVTCDNIPFNDDCSSALPQPDNIPTPGNLCCANSDDISGCNAFGTGYGVWYTMNSADYDTFDFTLTNGDAQGPDAGDGTNVGMVVYQDNGGGCGDFTTIACCPAVTDVCAGSLSGIGLTIEPNTDYYFLVYTLDAAGCGNFTLNTNLVYLGCTDPFADNYDPAAEIEDGSCTYTQPPANDLCADAQPLICGETVNGTTSLSTSAGAPTVCTGANDGGVWYTFVGDGQLITISTCGSAIDTRIAVATAADCAGPFTCEIAEDDDDTDEGCGFFDADDASVSFISQVGVNYYVYISAGSVDTNGDFVDDLFDGPFQLTFECEPVVEGCTNECACNYNIDANVDDASCEFTSCSGCGPGTVTVVMDMTDAFGDGWNGGTYSIEDLNGTVIASGDLDGACGDGLLVGIDVFCLEDGCYNMTVGGGAWDGEIGFTMTDGSGNTIAAGGAGTFSFTVGNGVCGCTDSGACNYDPAATDDDGSCEFLTCAGCTDSNACNFDSQATIEDNASCCYQNCGSLIMNDAFGDGWNGAVATITDAVSGLIVASGTIPNGLTATLPLCLADGCYVLSVTDGTWPAEVSWILTGSNGGIVTGGPTDGINFSIGSGNCNVGCTEPIACNYDPEAGLSDCNLCEYTSCQGCTYPEATNYNVDASIDDGTCIIEAVSTCPADLDSDGLVGVSDLVIFIGAYGTVCPN